MSITTEKEETVSKAVNLLKEYESLLERFERDGDLDELLLTLCYHKGELNPYWHTLTLKTVFKTISKPKVQKALLEEMSETELNDFVDLLDVQIDFFLSMDKDQFKAMLTRWDLEAYPDHHESRNINFIIKETERKMKSCRRAESNVEVL